LARTILRLFREKLECGGEATQQGKGQSGLWPRSAAKTPGPAEIKSSGTPNRRDFWQWHRCFFVVELLLKKKGDAAGKFHCSGPRSVEKHRIVSGCGEENGLRQYRSVPLGSGKRMRNFPPRPDIRRNPYPAISSNPRLSPPPAREDLTSRSKTIVLRFHHPVGGKKLQKAGSATKGGRRRRKGLDQLGGQLTTSNFAGGRGKSWASARTIAFTEGAKRSFDQQRSGPTSKGSGAGKGNHDVTDHRNGSSRPFATVPVEEWASIYTESPGRWLGSGSANPDSVHHGIAIYFDPCGFRMKPARPLKGLHRDPATYTNLVYDSECFWNTWVSVSHALYPPFQFGVEVGAGVAFSRCFG